MTQPVTDFFVNRAIVLGPQPDAAIDPGLAPAANTFQLIDGKSSTEFDKVERKIDRPFFTNTPFGVANKRAKIEGTFELTPPVEGTAAASCEPALLPAGMKATVSGNSVIYSPISRNIPMSAAYWWHSGTILKVLAARHNLGSLGMKIGDRFTGSLTVQGSYDEVGEEALPATLNYLAFPDPTICTPENTQMIVGTAQSGAIADLHLWGKSLSIDLGNDIKNKPYTEHRETGIGSRAPTFKALFVRPAKADFDVWKLRDAGTLITLAYRLTEDDGRYSELRVRGQIDQITSTDTDGDYTLDITGNCIASSAGGDEFEIEFGTL
jgi:hypothetical protein